MNRPILRAEAISDFLAAHGWSEARRSPLAGDASARRYERLRHRDRSAILMDVPPDSGLTTQSFTAVTRWLRGHGLSAPEILADDEDRGLLLLEDLGDDLIARLCGQDPSLEPALYASAIDLLAHLQSLPPPVEIAPRYDLAVLMREARLFIEWYLPAVTARPMPPGQVAEFEALATDLFSSLPPPSVPIYRDYHAENLLWLPDRIDQARVGLLDYQDMLIGHPAYDVVSLLRDARRDIAPNLRERLLTRYLTRTGADRDAFIHDAHILSAQRNLKILGLFTRLHRRDGKPRYLAHLPRVRALLAEDLSHPALARIAAFLAPVLR